jgi:hypothetical protein
VLYLWALVLTLRHDFRLVGVAQQRGRVPLATIYVAVAAGTYPLIFSFTPFTTQNGMQFWFLVGALHGVYSRRRGDTLAGEGRRRETRRRDGAAAP